MKLQLATAQEGEGNSQNITTKSHKRWDGKLCTHVEGRVSSIQFSHPLNVMDPSQVLHDGPPLGRPPDEHGLEGVPQHDDLAAQLRYVAVGHRQELVLVRHSLGRQLKLLSTPYRRCYSI